ncbi:MAG TPA: alanyl-tRNA editing protein, partial [Spirochaetales bacterium]|nr:alanyl-tRNA editing protein [Spirochaetales bacterium]
MSTEKLYYTEPETSHCDARVVSVCDDGDSTIIELDRNLFYPEGGGQPCDLGSIAGIPVQSVTESDDGRILHRLSAQAMADVCTLRAGDSVQLELNQMRRMDHSQQHSAQHLLSATILRLCGAPTRSFHLGERYSVIDVDTPSLPMADALTVEDEVLRVIRENWPMVTHLCPPEDVTSFPL